MANNNNDVKNLAKADLEATIQQPAVFVNKVIIQAKGLIRLTFLEAYGEGCQQPRSCVVMLRQDAIELQKLLGKLIESNPESRIILPNRKG